MSIVSCKVLEDAVAAGKEPLAFSVGVPTSFVTAGLWGGIAQDAGKRLAGVGKFHNPNRWPVTILMVGPDHQGEPIAYEVDMSMAPTFTAKPVE
jgi:hypothetical protein